MKIFQNMVGKCDTDSKQQELVLYQLMILKFRIDDELYRNYSISENQLRFLLFEYNLADDPEIKKLMNDIAQYEENLNSSMDWVFKFNLLIFKFNKEKEIRILKWIK